jgi:hypothetical protein
MLMLNDTLLAAFADKFYGYGNYKGCCWFIGMEEGGGGTCEEVQDRLKAWDARGRLELEDLADFHIAIGQVKQFTKPIKLQNTWRALIRILLSAKGEPFNIDDIKKYQGTKLGRHEGRTYLGELLPLPSPGTDKWYYKDWSNLNQVVSREEYIEHYVKARIAHIRQKIADYSPEFVVFYGTRYLEHWKAIADPSPIFVNGAGPTVVTTRGTIFAVVTHPSAPGVTNAYFDAVGAAIRGALGAPVNP